MSEFIDDFKSFVRLSGAANIRFPAQCARSKFTADIFVTIEESARVADDQCQIGDGIGRAFVAGSGFVY